MKLIVLITSLIAANFCFAAEQAQKTAPKSLPIVNDIPGYQYLPEPFYQVYSHGYVVSNKPSPGDLTVHVPVVNQQTINPGCYIACYSHDTGVYPVSSTVQVVGVVRIWGSYSSKTKLCEPHGIERTDISKNKVYIKTCNDQFPQCEGACWPGGDTTGWFHFNKVVVQTTEKNQYINDEGNVVTYKPLFKA